MPFPTTNRLQIILCLCGATIYLLLWIHITDLHQQQWKLAAIFKLALDIQRISTSEPLAQPAVNPLVFTIANHGYLNFTKNWILNLNALSGPKHAWNVVCTDSKSYAELQAFVQPDQRKQVLLYNASVSTTSFVRWGTKHFRMYTKQRPQIIQMIYTTYYGASEYDSILYVDADTAFVKDFRSSLSNNMHGDFDVVLQLDTNQFDCAGNVKASLWNICSCIIFVPLHESHHEKVERFLTEYNQECVSGGGRRRDQAALNSVIRKNMLNKKDAIRVGYFNCTEWPSGKLMDNQVFARQTANSTVMIHANWRTGEAAKRAFLEKHHQWYL